MFEVNHCFEIGSSHIICQDYALSGQIELDGVVYHYGIVCDGCSSSKDTDVGSRYLAMATRKILNIELKNDPNIANIKADVIANKIIQEASKYNDSEILLKNCSYDSTLLFFIADDKNYRVFFFGDGCAYIDDNGKHLYSLEYAENAPPYLSYRLYNDRLFGYGGKYGQTNKNLNVWNVDDINHPSLRTQSFTKIVDDPYLDLIGDVETLKQISLFTDGIFSFERVDQKGLNKVSFIDASIDYVNYPVKKGEFTIRNFKFNAKNNLKNGIRHFDDLSCVSIVRS